MFLGGLAVVVIATEAGIGSYDDVLFWDHMVQHLLLLMVAPPMLVVGQPGEEEGRPPPPPRPGRVPPADPPHTPQVQRSKDGGDRGHDRRELPLLQDGLPAKRRQHGTSYR